jgi:hypothetical protein
VLYGHNLGGLATGASLGYAGGVDLRAGYLGGGIYEADGHLLGVAARSALEAPSGRRT